MTATVSACITWWTLRLLEIVGEAAKNVSPEIRERHGTIPWREIGGTRDRLIHGYFDVDLDIVWQIASGDLPTLLPLLRAALTSLDPNA